MITSVIVLEKPDFFYEMLDNFQVWKWRVPSPQWNFQTWGWTRRVPQQGELKQFLHEKRQQICKPLHLRSKKEQQELKRALSKGLSIRPDEAKQREERCLHWGCPKDVETHLVSKQWDQTGDTYKGSFVSARVANKSIWGQPRTLHQRPREEENILWEGLGWGNSAGLLECFSSPEYTSPSKSQSGLWFTTQPRAADRTPPLILPPPPHCFFR